LERLRDRRGMRGEERSECGHVLCAFHDQDEFGMTEVIRCPNPENIPNFRDTFCAPRLVSVDDNIGSDLRAVHEERAVRGDHDLLGLRELLQDRSQLVNSVRVQM
jgi:hypothetical protein